MLHPERLQVTKRVQSKALSQRPKSSKLTTINLYLDNSTEGLLGSSFQCAAVDWGGHAYKDTCVSGVQFGPIGAKTRRAALAGVPGCMLG